MFIVSVRLIESIKLRTTEIDLSLCIETFSIVSEHLVTVLKNID